MPRKRLRDAGQTARQQARGTKENAQSFASGTRVDDALPAGIRGLIAEFFHLIPHALGRGTARQQITSSIILGILIVLTSPATVPVTGGVILALLVPLVITMLLGFYRFIPAVNQAWKGSRARDAVKKDRDIPGWRRE